MSSENRGEQLKKLLTKFRKSFTLTDENALDFQDFFRLIDLNGQLAKPKNLCVNDWCLVNESQTRDHRSFFTHTIVEANAFLSKDSFIQLAKEHGKCTVTESGVVSYLQTPLTAPIQLQASASDSQLSIQSQQSNLMARQSTQNFAEELPREDLGDDISVANSYADNMAYVDSLNKEERNAYKARQMFDEDGSSNTGIEIIRLNKKFDIFMKRFMRAEEDIKEVKQNFYRVMHCAFAKYEQGFKRKNEYLERRRLKHQQDISKGVSKRLNDMNMDKDLNQLAANELKLKGQKLTDYDINQNLEDSSIGMQLHQEESVSVGNLHNKYIEDSELSTLNVKPMEKSSNVIDTAAKKNPLKAKLKKDKKKDKKKKKKKEDSSESEPEKEPVKPQRQSKRLMKPGEEDESENPEVV